MENVDSTLDMWQRQLNQCVTSDSDIEANMNVSQHINQPEVSAMSNLWNDDNNLTCNHETEYVLPTDVGSLNDDQQHAYDIVNWHLRETITGRMPPQLLMMIPGEGGVGNSRLIQTMTEIF